MFHQIKRPRCICKVDAGNGFSSLAFQAGAPLLVDKAKTQGIAALSIINCCHFHALWHEVEYLADEGTFTYEHIAPSMSTCTTGLASMAFLTSKSFVAHCGGSSQIYGTNPMAFGFPRKEGEPPVIWDQASAFMARGDVSLFEQQGLQLPEGVAVGPDGVPTTDPAEALAGAQLTFGGHKVGKPVSCIFSIWTTHGDGNSNDSTNQ